MKDTNEFKTTMTVTSFCVKTAASGVVVGVVIEALLIALHLVPRLTGQIRKQILDMKLYGIQQARGHHYPG